MKVALVHDDLVQWGGAERMLLGISEIFPDAPIFTSLVDSTNKLIMDRFGDKKIVTSFLQKIPFGNKLYKTFFPLYPIAFEQFDFSEFDVVISQTTRFAKSIITKPETVHICYCHTPPRFLWNFNNPQTNGLVNLIMSKFRIYDQISAKRVDYFLAGSENCKKRIKKIYHQQSKVLAPFVDLKKVENVSSFDGGYFLIIARLNKYKMVDLAVDVFAKRKDQQLIVVGSGPELGNLKKRAAANTRFLSNISEELLTKLLSGCRALIITAKEDFGLTSLEAQSLGKPVIALNGGGVLETVIDNKTGVLFDSQTKESLEKALDQFMEMNFDAVDCKNNSSKFSFDRFKGQFLGLIKESMYNYQGKILDL